jgi:hypothetical protein
MRGLLSVSREVTTQTMMCMAHSTESEAKS